MSASLTLDQASTLVQKLGDINVNTVMVSVAGDSNGAIGAREHHVALAPQQNFDVIAVAEVLRSMGYSFHFVEVMEGAEGQRGFVITPPPATVESAEEVVDGDPRAQRAREHRESVWECGCGHFNGREHVLCRNCGMPKRL